MPDWLKQWAVTLLVPLIVAAVSYGGIKADISHANATADKAVSRDEFMATFGQIQHQLSEIHADIRQLNGRAK